MTLPKYIVTGLLLLAFVAGCRHDPEPAAAPPPAPDYDAALYLALGDSYTIGQNVPAEENFPHLLATAMERHDRHLGPPAIIARTGWTINDLLDAIAEAKLSPHYQLITLCIGVNNQFQGLPLADYSASFDQLLLTAKTLAGGDASRVIVVSIPDYSATPFGHRSSGEVIAKQIDAFNTVAHDHALAAGARWVDITPLTRAVKPDEQASDGLHYSAKMHARWVDLILPEALKITAPAAATAIGKQ